ncbi:hypothetical protein DFH06DRAFT_1148756 [Mycena polygramma]|nr:hypothetical protein DFH06DRAFT_1148756 [Mycena polygramma]
MSTADLRGAVNSDKGRGKHRGWVDKSVGLPPVPVTGTAVESTGWPRGLHGPSSCCKRATRDGTVYGTAVAGTRVGDFFFVSFMASTWSAAVVCFNPEHCNLKLKVWEPGKKSRLSIPATADLGRIILNQTELSVELEKDWSSVYPIYALVGKTKRTSQTVGTATGGSLQKRQGTSRSPARGQSDCGDEFPQECIKLVIIHS